MTKSGASAVQAAAMGHNSGNLKSFVASLLKNSKEIDDIKMRNLAIMNQANDAGFDRSALKFVVKEAKNPMDLEKKQKINEMCQKLGKEPVFILSGESDNENEAA